MKIVEVDWEDSAGSHDWRKGVTIRPQRIKSVGYLAQDDEECLVLVESRVQTEEPDVAENGCSTAIPRSAVRRVRELRPKR